MAYLLNDWERPADQQLFPIRNASIKPKLLRRHIKPFGVEKTTLNDLTEVLQNPQLPVDTPATLSLQGMACYETITNRKKNVLKYAINNIL